MQGTSILRHLVSYSNSHLSPRSKSSGTSLFASLHGNFERLWCQKVVSTVSKCLNKGLVYGSPLDNVNLKKLPKLKTLSASAYAIGPSYPVGIRSILLEIIEAPLKTIETLELVGMEHYISSFSGRSIEGESIFWRYFDSILVTSGPRFFQAQGNTSFIQLRIDVEIGSLRRNLRRTFMPILLN